MVKAIDLIGSNSQLQSHWARRLIAIIIDWIIMFVIWWIITIMLVFVAITFPAYWFWALYPFFTGLIWLAYSAFLEGIMGATIGKRLLSLMVVSTEGPMDLTKAIVRNVTKIHGLLLLIDWLAGFVTDGDPRQRYLDRIAGTTVVRTDAQEVFIGAYQPPAGPIPVPYQGPSYQAQPQAGPYQYPAQQGYEAGPEAGPAPTAEERVESVETKVSKEYSREELVNLKKEELTKIARDKGLKVSGTKRDLIDRILGEEVEE